MILFCTVAEFLWVRFSSMLRTTNLAPGEQLHPANYLILLENVHTFIIKETSLKCHAL
jgi:hypothetical protein